MAYQSLKQLCWKRWRAGYLSNDQADHELPTAQVMKEKGLINVPGHLEWGSPQYSCDLMFSLHLLSRCPISYFCNGLSHNNFCLSLGKYYFVYNEQTSISDSQPCISLTQDRLSSKLWTHAFHAPHCWCTKELQTSLLQLMKSTDSYWNVYTYTHTPLHFHISWGEKKKVFFFSFFLFLTPHCHSITTHY